jgi:hypothetical protein
MCWLYLTSNEGEALLLPFTSPALGWLYDKGDQLLYSLLLPQECYQTSVQGLALLQMMAATLCKPSGRTRHRSDAVGHPCTISHLAIFASAIHMQYKWHAGAVYKCCHWDSYLI